MSATTNGKGDRDELALAHHNLREMHLRLLESAQRERMVNELLVEHRELGRMQGNRIDELERALGETQAKLRAAQNEIQRLTTLLNGFAPRTTP